MRSQDYGKDIFFVVLWSHKTINIGICAESTSFIVFTKLFTFARVCAIGEAIQCVKWNRSLNFHFYKIKGIKLRQRDNKDAWISEINVFINAQSGWEVVALIQL